MQTNIFGEVEACGLTFEQAANKACVSTATIRNWIKTGYLTQTSNGLITQTSLEKFMSEIAGKEKLTTRANKLLKDDHNHAELTIKIAQILEKNKGEQIGVEYESSLSDSYRNKEGIYYTPSWVVKDLFNGLRIYSDTTFLDPCCGSGNFLIEAINRGVNPNNIYGFDIDENAVQITKQRIKDEFGFETTNVRVGDFLNESIKLKQDNKSFDLIFTNPPWGKKIEKSIKQRFATLYDCGNSLDTTSLFFGASLAILKPNGKLGFLIQEAFFNITTFEYIRKKALSKKILRLIDYGKAFKGLVTKAQALVIENTSSKDSDLIECSLDDKKFNRSIRSFSNNPKSILNFWTNETEAQVINQLYSIQHITLKNNANWALGIVTGNNDRYCTEEPMAGYIPIYKGADITKNGLKEPSTYIPDDFSNFQQVAPIELYQSQEKLIYRFISSDLYFFCDKQQRFILNSANLLIPLNIGISGQQLTQLLNSEIINWLFKKLFATHKILRGDLELLPIHIDYFATHREFTEDDYLNFLKITKTSDGTFRIKDQNH